MNILQLVAAIIFFITAILFFIFRLIIYKLDRQLIELGTYKALGDDITSAKIQYDNYYNFLKKSNVDIDSVDRNLFMSIYCLGKFDGLQLALTRNKKEVEKILEKFSAN